MRRPAGFSLFELLLVLALTAVVIVLAGGGLRERLIVLYLADARLGLAHDALFLERHHAMLGRYGSATTRGGARWPRLPVPGTAHYCFVFGAVREHTAGRYRLLALPRHAWLGERYLEMDQDGLISERRDETGRQKESCRQAAFRAG